MEAHLQPRDWTGGVALIALYIPYV